MPYKTLSAYRRAHRKGEDSSDYKKSHNLLKDYEQYGRWKKVLGDKEMPETLAEFQEMKYNNNKKFDELKELKDYVRENPNATSKDYKLVKKLMFISKQKLLNILNAIEKGIVTLSTKERLEVLENKKVEIENKIEVEKTKTKLQLEKKDVIAFIKKAISKDPRQMVNMLIKEIILYNDKIEIYMNYTNKKTPDDENHKAFLFYQTTNSITINSHKFHVEPKLCEYDIRLNI
ncbi:MAG: hypothetical protein SPG06_01085 [Eubacteriales bacterium]|nr:hypothetical protein [Eubacteriales bacterium]